MSIITITVKREKKSESVAVIKRKKRGKKKGGLCITLSSYQNCYSGFLIFSFLVPLA